MDYLGGVCVGGGPGQRICCPPPKLLGEGAGGLAPLVPPLLISMYKKSLAGDNL